MPTAEAKIATNGDREDLATIVAAMANITDRINEYELAFGKLLMEARILHRAGAAGNCTWEKWCTDNVVNKKTGKPYSDRHIRRLIEIAEAEDPEAAQAEQRVKHRAEMRAKREAWKAERTASQADRTHVSPPGQTTSTADAEGETVDDEEEIIIEEPGPEPEPFPEDLVDEVMPPDADTLLKVLRRAFDPGSTPAERHSAQVWIMSRDARLTALEQLDGLQHAMNMLKILNQSRNRFNMVWEQANDARTKLMHANRQLAKAKATIAHLRKEIVRLKAGSENLAA